MSKFSKKDYRNIIILIITFILLVLLITRFNYIYGSNLDWKTQHFNFPEYFRTLFYKNFNLFPSFAFNIGAGQNIYNLSYYGLLNPIILVSYLLPFIKMIDYIMISSMLCVIISVILFYKWLKNKEYSVNISLFSSFLFLFSSPLILHSHRHIMFINYLPFLIMGLMSIDSYFKNNKRFMLILSVFLIIMTSYYYSIPSLFVLVIYGIYTFIKKEKKITVKSFFIEGFKFLLPIIIGIICSSIILIPTLYVILTGRADVSRTQDLISILIPKLNLNYLLYSSYSVGLTSIIIISLIYAFISKKRENIFMSTIISVICLLPLIVFILNGMLYIDSKVLIPFIPLCLLLITEFIKDLFDKKINIIKVIILFIIISILFCLTVKYNSIIFYLIDFLAMIIMLLIFKKFKYGIIISTILISLGNMLFVNFNDDMMSVDDYNYIYNDKIDELFNEVLKSDEIYRSTNYIDTLTTSNKIYNSNYYNASIYSSTYNSLYRNFYVEHFSNDISYRNNLITSSPNNILWNTLMGVKYVVSDKDSLIGYEKIKQNGNYSLYKNDNVFSIGYASSNLMSEYDYKKLDYPYKMEALLNNIIINKDVESNYESNILEYKINYNNVKYSNLNIDSNNNHIIINSKDNGKITIPLKEKLNNKILLIRFNMNYEEKCNVGDTSITINGVKNLLTCKSWKYKNKNNTFDYVISSNDDIDKLNIEFSKGKYDISDIKTYILSYDDVLDSVRLKDRLVLDKEKTKGDIIEGNINVTKDGYFTITIPYDKGFKIYVDNKLVNYEKVNYAFIGFKINKGNHNIKLVYKSPMKNISIILSMCSIICSIFILIIERKRGKRVEKRKD